MDLLIIPARLEHAEDFTKVIVRSWHAAYPGIIPQDYLDRELTTEAFLPRAKSILSRSQQDYLALLQDNVIGAFSISGYREDNADITDGEVVAINLLPEYLGRGYGFEMIQSAIKLLQSKGYTKIHLWTLAENSRARKFYEKCGFVHDGVIKTIFIGKPLVEVHYFMTL